MRATLVLITMLGCTASAAVQDLRLTAGLWPEPSDTVTFDNTDGQDDSGRYEFGWYTPTHIGLAYARRVRHLGPSAIAAGIEGAYTRTGGNDVTNNVHAGLRTFSVTLLPAYVIDLRDGFSIEGGPTLGWNHHRLNWSNGAFVGSGYGDSVEYGARVAGLLTLRNGLQFGLDVRSVNSSTTIDIDYGADVAPFRNYDHETKTHGFAVLASVGYRL